VVRPPETVADRDLTAREVDQGGGDEERAYPTRAALLEQQRGFGAKEQWVSAEKGNEKGVPFYLARGFTVRGEETRWSKAGYPYTLLRLWRTL
jgi:hypothetical protein